MKQIFTKAQKRIDNIILSVPIAIKVVGIGLIPILILGASLNYWIVTGLSGWLSYILIDARVQAAMNVGARSVALITILGSILSILVSLFLTFILMRPILALRKMAQQVADGHLDTRAKVWAKDEIGELAIAVNTMTDHLLATQDDMIRINRIQDTINKIALASEQKTEIHDALYKTLESILSNMGLKTGWVYLRDPERQIFHLASWCGVPEDLQKYLLHEPEDALCSCQINLVSGESQIDERKCGRLENCQSTIPIPPPHYNPISRTRSEIRSNQLAP